MNALLSLAMVLLPAQAELSNEALAERAEEAFARGVELRQAADQARPHFQAAARDFQELQRRGARNPLLYRNLGNASLLGDDLPRAVFAYRLGLRLAPGDPALNANLDRARKRVAYPNDTHFGRPPVEVHPPWLPRPGGQVLGLAGAGYVLAWVLLTRWLMVRRGRFLALGLPLLVCATAAGAWVWQVQGEERREPLVVIAEDGVLLRKGDGLTYPARYDTPVNRGVEAILLFERDGWLQIELTDGEVGWIPRNYALVEGASG